MIPTHTSSNATVAWRVSLWIAAIMLALVAVALSFHPTAVTHAAGSHTMPHGSYGSCGYWDSHMGIIATSSDPNYPPYSADYAVTSTSALPNQPFQFLLAAYAPKSATSPPFTATLEVLQADNKYLPVTGGSGTWTATQCGPDNDVGSVSKRYLWVGHWTAPVHTGSYALALEFQFSPPSGSNLVTTDFFVNVQVITPAPPGSSFVHWHTVVPQLSGALQNIYNEYNLDTLSTSMQSITATTYFVFSNDPFASGSATFTGAMADPASLNTPPDISPFFLPAGGIPLAKLPPSPPPYVPFRQFFNVYQYGAPTPGQGVATAKYGRVDLNGNPDPTGPANYTLTIEEPLQLSTGGFPLKVGKYVVDNSYTGLVTGASQWNNAGEGQSFTFYANPVAPYISATGPGNYETIAWPLKNPALVDPSTQIAYNVTVITHSAPLGSPPLISGAFTSPQIVTNTLQPGVQYDADVLVVFTQGSGSSSSTIYSDDMASTLNAPATVNMQVATTSQPYAWLYDYETPAGPLNPLLRSTGMDAARSNTATSNTFYWPIGRPFNLLPAMSDHPDQVAMTLTQGANTAVVYPSVVTSGNYTVSSADCLNNGQPMSISGNYGPTDQNNFPNEINPVTQTYATTDTIKNSLHLIMLNGYSGTSADAQICDLSSWLSAPGGKLPPSGIKFNFNVTQNMIFILYFPNVPASGTSICGMHNATSSPLAAFDPPGQLPNLHNSVGPECNADTVTITGTENMLNSMSSPRTLYFQPPNDKDTLTINSWTQSSDTPLGQPAGQTLTINATASLGAVMPKTLFLKPVALHQLPPPTPVP